MDWSHFGMTRRPFKPVVDTGAFYPAASHEAALTSLTSAHRRHDLAVLVDGPPGAGKSLVGRKWLEQLPADVPRIVLANVKALTPSDLLQAILFDLNQPYQGLTEQELRLAVSAQLMGVVGAGQAAVILVDEAQHLSPGAIEELRLLGNIETAERPALFLVLVAQPGLREALSRPPNLAFAMRVGARARIESFSPEESIAYVHHQVNAAGGSPQAVFDSEAVSLLAGGCGGVARVLNRAAGLALELAAGAGASVVDVEAALEALAELGLPATGQEEPGRAVVLRHTAEVDESAQLARGKRGGVRPEAGEGEHVAPTRSKQKSARSKSA